MTEPSENTKTGAQDYKSSDEYASPVIQFGRFVDNRLELFRARTTEQEYIAISHVWGKTQWIHVDNLDFKILASKAKANFVKNKMAKLLGSMAFWMDTITVNQEDPVEVVATVQSIPAIFRDASKTLVLRERGSLQECCVHSVANSYGWSDLRSSFVNHIATHFGMSCFDTYLQRLWTFQEVLLSHTIEFVYYGPCVARKSEKRWAQWNDGQSMAVSYLDSLFILGRTFSGDSEDSITTSNFVRAYITGENIKRDKPPLRTMQEDIYADHFRDYHLASTRSATLPRDYIFATMPQFPWYHYPESAIDMSFGEIFFDLFRQAKRSNRPFLPRITRSMTDHKAVGSEAWLPSLDLPESKCLGDFLKLFGQPGIGDPHFTTSVVVRTLEDECTMDILDLVAEAMLFSRELWTVSNLAPEISRFGTIPDTGLRFRGERNLFMNAQRDRDNIQLIQGQTSNGELKSPKLSDDTATEQENQLNQQSSLNEMAQHVEDHGWYKIYRFEPSFETSQERDSDWETSSSASTEAREHYVKVIQDRQDENLRTLHRNPEWQLKEAHRMLAYLWQRFDPRNTQVTTQLSEMVIDILKDATPSLLRIVLLLTAMIGCQLPLSTVFWTQEHFIPVKIRYGTFNVLGLLSRHAVDSACINGKLMHSYGRHMWSKFNGRDLTINHPTTKVPVGLVPDFYCAPRQIRDVKDKITALYDQSDETGLREGGFQVSVL